MSVNCGISGLLMVACEALANSWQHRGTVAEGGRQRLAQLLLSYASEGDDAQQQAIRDRERKDKGAC